jgi:single-strand DNA-binding protein
MANYNKVILLGNLTRDPQLRYLPNSTAVCDFGLAVNRRWRDKDGNQKEEVCFVDISTFGRQAETLNQYMTKGRSLLVEGHLRLDTWTGQDGQKRSKLSVVAENCQFLGGRGEQPAGGAPQERSAPSQEAAGPAAAAPETDDVPPTGDDLPF